MIPVHILAQEQKNRALAARMPVGSSVRATVPLASLKPGEVAEVIGITQAGELRLKISADYTPIVNPAHLEPYDLLDTDPL
jgi:hypothetical protein